MDTRALRFNALRRIGMLACAALLAGCVVPATSVRYGHVVSEPNVYYDATPLEPAPYYDPPVYYGGTVVTPAPIIVDRPVYSPWYPAAPVYRGYYNRPRFDSPRHHRPRFDSPRRHPPGARDRDRGGRHDQGAQRPPRPPRGKPGGSIRSSELPRWGGQAGGPVRPSSGENSGP